MIPFETVKNFYPPYLRDNAAFHKYILKEYILLLMLDYLSTTPFIRKIAFIGGTSIRLTKGIDRFSEDIDFDCKEFSGSDFIEMTNAVIKFLSHNGFDVEVKENFNKKLKAFRRNIIFPQLLYKLGISGHKEEKFLVKIECQDQLFDYKNEMINIKGCGLFFPVPVPPPSILCSMKIAAMLNRQKGRDFYDVIFLLSQTAPDYNYLAAKCGILNLEELKEKVKLVLETVDLKSKIRDFEHLLFNKANASKILRIGDFFSEMN